MKSRLIILVVTSLLLVSAVVNVKLANDNRELIGKANSREFEELILIRKLAIDIQKELVWQEDSSREVYGLYLNRVSYHYLYTHEYKEPVQASLRDFLIDAYDPLYTELTNGDDVKFNESLELFAEINDFLIVLTSELTDTYLDENQIVMSNLTPEQSNQFIDELDRYTEKVNSYFVNN